MQEDRELEELYSKLSLLSNEPLQSASDLSSNELSADFILGLGSGNMPKDKDQTLGEFLSKFTKNPNPVNQAPEQDYSEDSRKLLSFIDEFDRRSNETMDKNQIFTNSRNIEVKDKQESDKRFIGEKYISDNVYSSLSKQVRQSGSKRNSGYANTEARLVDETLVAPLNLARYTSEE